MKYRPEVDGLRAVAVVPVVLFHAGYSAFAGGYVGVDVFFVISGYLITSLLLQDLSAGRFSLRDFYERRARRILPALYVVIAACLPAAWLLLSPADMQAFARSVVSTVLFFSNVLFWSEADYFASAAELKPLLHTWSLSVEEQFYLVFPPLLWLAWKLPRGGVAWAVALVGVASLALSAWGATHAPEASFYLVHTRAWELAAGALAALWLRGRPPASGALAEAGGLAGLAMIVASVALFDADTPFPGTAALLPVAGTVALILFAGPATLAGRLLAMKPLVALGLLSYSIYLWHQPLLAFARHYASTSPSPALVAALVLASFVLAAVTWKFVEVPARDRRRFSSRQVFACAALGSLLLLAAGVAGHLSQGTYWSTQRENMARDIDHRLRPNQGLSGACDGRLNTGPKCRTHEAPTILVWGDSMAMQVVAGLLASDPDARIVQLTHSACPPLPGVAPVRPRHGRAWSQACLDFNDAALSYLRGSDSITHVVLAGQFGNLLRQGAMTVDRSGEEQPGRRVAEKQLRRTLEQIREAGAVPVIFAPPPHPGWDVGRCEAKRLQRGWSERCEFPQAASAARQQAEFRLLRGFESEATIIWPGDGICTDGTCASRLGDAILYRDMTHLSHEGSAALGRRMDFVRRVEAAR